MGASPTSILRPAAGPLPGVRARLLAVTLLVLAGACVAAADASADEQPTEHWFSVHLDGRKIGHLHSTRTPEGAVVHSERRLQMRLERNGEPLVVSSRERSTESRDGAPLAFETELDLAGHVTAVRAEVVEGQVRISAGRDGHPPSEQRYPWPEGALLAEGQRLAALRHPLVADARFEIAAFDPASQRRQQVHWEVLGDQPVDIHGQIEALVAVRQTVTTDQADDTGLVAEAWLRADDRALRRLRLPALGLQLEMLATDRDHALSPDQPTDVLAATLVQSPRPLGLRERRDELRYRIDAGDVDAMALHGLPGQRVLQAGDGQLTLLVDPAGSTHPPPTEADLQSTRWLQSDAPEIRALARRAIGRERDVRRQMERLEQRVRRHIATKSLRIGYASALEAYHLREGDCTEHAVLLAAMARASGIPARVANGLAYTDAFGGREHVFVPHAWVFAWIDGRWQGFDAALPQHDAGHIALAVDHGDPFRFYRGLELIGRLRVDAVESLAPAAGQAP
jgi:hypothetical protein